MCAGSKRGRTIPWLVVLSCLALHGIAGAARAEQGRHYCIAEKPIVLLIIDMTTEYDDRDRSLLMEAIQHILTNLEGGERLVIRTITDSFSTSDRLFDQCVPVCIPKRKTFIGSGCSDGTIKIDKRRMRDGAATAMRERLRHFQARDDSDIIRTLEQIARDVPFAGKTSRIYVYSDMIEVSDHMRGQFFAASNARLIEKLRTTRLIPDLNKAEVHVFGVGRSGLPGRPPLPIDKMQKLNDFWTLYFKAADAGSLTITEGLPR